jgi:hypothetical protein
VSPLVWQQLGQRKGGELGVASSKTDESHADQEVSIRLCCATYDEADEEEDIATYDEPSAPKKIAVCCLRRQHSVLFLQMSLYIGGIPPQTMKATVIVRV